MGDERGSRCRAVKRKKVERKRGKPLKVDNPQGSGTSYFSFPDLVIFNGKLYFYCEDCRVLGRMKHFQGIIYGECRGCGKEYVLSEEGDKN